MVSRYMKKQRQARKTQLKKENKKIYMELLGLSFFATLISSDVWGKIEYNETNKRIYE